MKISNNSEVLEDELSNNFYLNYRDYTEIKLLQTSDSDGYCYRCNKPLIPLTWLDPEYYYLPCWDCIGKRKSEKALLTENIIRNIKDFYTSKILGDRYLQLFIVDNIYFSNTIPHNYSVFKKIINSIDPPSRNDIWFLDWSPGFPKIISCENMDGLKIVNLSSLYNIEQGKDVIKVGDFEISMPEFVSFDLKHHSRSSILNKKGDRKSKRIKIGDKCIKFYNTDDSDIKSIFKLTKNGEEVAIGSLSYQDYAIIKLAIMRNKTFLRTLFDVILEMLKSVGTFKDTVFLKNTIQVDPSKELGFNLIWTSISEKKSSDYINISLI